MRISRIFLLNYYACRSISFSHIKNKNNVARTARFMKKLFDNIQPERQQNVTRKTDVNYLPIVPHLSTQMGVSHSKLKRMKVVNKMFMKYITEIMATDFPEELSTRNIEIIDVKVTAQFDRLDVIWIEHSDSEENYDISTEELLKNYSGYLHHELSQLHTLSYVPCICFVKSRYAALMKEVNKRLAILQKEELCFEESKEQPVQPSPFLSEFNLHKDPSQTLDTREDSDAAKDITETNVDITLPLMHQNVFGLDHYCIMGKIKTNLNKSKKAAEKRGSIISSDIDNSPSSEAKKSLTREDAKEIFSKFLMKRKLEKKYKFSERKIKRNQESMLTGDMEGADSFDPNYEDDYKRDT